MYGDLPNRYGGMMTVNSSVSKHRPRIVAVSYKALSRLIHSITSEYADRAQITAVDKVFDEASEIARKLVSRGEVDVLLSAGANATYLADSLGIPVVRVPVTGLDVMRALLKARTISDHIALVTYQQPNSELDEIKELINLDIEQRTYSTVDDAKETFRDLAHRGFRVIIGSSLVTEWAERRGLTGILVYSRNSIRSTIESAIEIARIRYVEEQRTERINTILGHLNEGVAAVDTEQRVVLANPAMESLIGLSSDNMRGKRLDDIAPQLGLADVLKRGEPSLGQIAQINRKTIVINRIPILGNGVVTGAVLTIQDAQAISRADRSIRSRNRRTKFTARYTFADIIGSSPDLCRARQLCEQYAKTDATVLITGETGTGKELFAQSMHNASRRGSAPFVAVNCGAIPDSLLESELFGYEEGAFTGSRRGGQAGLFELAHTGTIYLDEIGEMPVSLQTRLLRVLQEKVVMPLGGDPVPIDVRVIAATHCDLNKAMEEGSFRQDLFYRLNILKVGLPPLRQCADDVVQLARKLLRDKLGAQGVQRDIEKHIERIAPFLRRHTWPGNVRELENIMERLAVLSDGFDMFNDGQEEDGLRAVIPELFTAVPGDSRLEDTSSLKQFVERTESQRIRDTVQECHGNISEAARKLHLSRTTLWRKLRKS